MGLVVTYYMPADASSGPWTEDLSDAVRLGTIDGIVDEAELGSVGISSLLFDDEDGTLGTSHYADGIRGLKRIWIDETSCPAGDQRLFTGWIGDRRYRRGADSFRTGVARKIDVTLVDANTMLSFRVFAPVNGSNSTAYNASNSFIRPAETDLQRVAALLTVPFLTSVHDTGFISTGTGQVMDACDYTGQHPADVLNDCAQQSGRNFFIRFDEAADEFSLHYVDDGDLSDAATIRISNVLSDVDGVTTFAPEPEAELVRDPSRVSAAVYLPFNGSNSPAYKTRIQTEYDYGWRDSSAPSSNVKTLAQANIRALRYLNTTSTEDDRITCTLKLPASVVTGIKQGQIVQAKFSHLPNGPNAVWPSSFMPCRVLNRTVMANEMTNALYKVRLELSPLVMGCQTFVLTTGVIDVGDRGDAGGPTVCMLPVTIPAGGKMTVVRYDWTGYPAKYDGSVYSIAAAWEDSLGVQPPALGWAANTTLGASLGYGTGGGADTVTEGNGFIIYGPPGISWPALTGGADSGEELRNPSGSPVSLYLRCGSNPFYGAVGTWSITTTVIVCPAGAW